MVFTKPLVEFVISNQNFVICAKPSALARLLVPADDTDLIGLPMWVLHRYSCNRLGSCLEGCLIRGVG